MSAADDWESEAGPATQASRQAQLPAQLEFVDAEDDEDVLEVEPEPAGEEELAHHRAVGSAQSVFAQPVFAQPVFAQPVFAQPVFAHAPGVSPRSPSTHQSSLHTLLQIESLSRTTGVFLVVSGDDGGYLHLVEGELVHAETGRLSGEAAALEILSWRDASLEPSLRTLAPVRTVHSSLQSLLGHAGADVGSQPGSQQASHVTQRSAAVNSAPFGAAVSAPFGAAVSAPFGAAGSAPFGAAGSAPFGAAGSAPFGAAGTPSQGPLNQDAPTETYLPPLTAAAVTAEVVLAPALAASPETAPAVGVPPSVAPPPLPRSEREAPSTVAEVVVSAAGEMVQGRGAATEELAARVAYAARLAELIGRAIRSGTPRAVELRGKTTQTLVRWQGDGNLSASLDLPQPSRR